MVACLATFAASPVLHAEDAKKNTGSASASASSSSHNSSDGAKDKPGTRVKVTRASDFLGSDVLASDDRKVGDIVDYVFDVNAAPHLQYVVVMTGGFLDMGGDRRAIPASAMSTSGDTCRVAISSDEYWNVPVLPVNSQRFLDTAKNRQDIAGFFKSDGDAKQRKDSAGGASNSAELQLITFSDLRNADAYSDQGNRLGFFADAWINLDDARAPFVEITSTFRPFRTNFDRRYAVPTQRIEKERESYGYKISVTRDDLTDAEVVSETEGVKMLRDGSIGNAVLRVRLPEA